MQEPMISVVMPVYNAEKYVALAVESILKQTYTNFEFIIVDDCSTDKSYQILQKYANQDTRIFLYRNSQNIKLASSLNFAIKQAIGKYIVRMDHDDVATCDRLMRQLTFMEQNPDITISGTYYRTFISDIKYPQNDIVFESDHKSIEIKMYLFGNVIAHPTVIMKRDIFENEKFLYNESLGESAEDYDLWVRLLDNGAIFSILPEFLLYYRVNNNQMSKIYATNINLLNKHIITNGLAKLFKTDITSEIIHTHMNILLAPKGIDFIFKFRQYYEHLRLLKDINAKNKVFDINTFNRIIEQYYIINKIKKKFVKWVNHL